MLQKIKEKNSRRLDKRRARRADRSVARDISYSTSASSRGGQALIRTVENLTGRPRLIKRAAGYELEVAQGRDFWHVMVERYGVEIDFLRGDFDKIPKEGPLVVISNHPYGILDGMVLGYLLSKTRGDFRIVAHQVFRKAEDLNRIILPISFDESRAALKVNLETRRVGVDYLKAGGCVGIFPGGTVSTALSPMGRAMDPVWRNFTAKLIQKSGATVVPLYFDGANSRLFQVASHAHYTLRMALLIREFKKRVKNRVPLVVGDPITQADLAPYANDANAMMDFLRQETYRLSPEPIEDLSYGYEFEAQYR